MTNPGVALMVIVGVGLGAFLYYMFAGDNSNNQHQYSNEGPPPSEPPDPWNLNPNERVRRRKRGSSVSSTRKSSMTSSGKPSCTICCELAERDCMQLYPCKHEFHKTCIAKWREQGPMEARNTCPNCRETIFGSSF